MSPTHAAPRYGRVARWLHGGIGAWLVGQIVFGLALDALAPRGSPGRADVINLHKLLAGWLASNLSRHGLRLFGWRIPPWGPDVPLLYQTCNALHVALAWALGLLILGHVAMGLWHGLMRRDGVLQRMLPWWPRP